MRHCPVSTVLTLLVLLILALPAKGQQSPKPFTQDQVQAMVHDGLGDETGAKALEQRGIDFVPSEDFIQSLKTAGASEAFLAALRAGTPGLSLARNVAPTFSVWCHDILYSGCQDILYTGGGRVGGHGVEAARDAMEPG